MKPLNNMMKLKLMETNNLNETTMEEQELVSVFDMENVDSILNSLENNANLRVDNAVPELSHMDYSSDAQQQHDDVLETGSDIIDDEIDAIERNRTVVDESQSRFSGAEWFEKAKSYDVMIAGVGGIGSWASLLISRFHPAIIRLFDPDTIEEANMSGQLFSIDDIGENKCIVMNRTISLYSNYYSTYTYCERFAGQTSSDIMICGFDNMASRKTFFNTWKRRVMSSQGIAHEMLYIDGRLGMEEMQVFAIRGDETENIKRYEQEYLFDDSEAEQVPCSMKQTSYMAAMIGSVISNIFANFAANSDYNMDVRTFPFITLYDARDMRMQIKY